MQGQLLEGDRIKLRTQSHHTKSPLSHLLNVISVMVDDQNTPSSYASALPVSSSSSLTSCIISKLSSLEYGLEDFVGS